MANHMWLVATKNKEEFKDADKLEKLLQKEFPEYLFRKGAHSDIHPATSIVVYSKVDSSIAPEFGRSYK
jgi:hypothetical protein